MFFKKLVEMQRKSPQFCVFSICKILFVAVKWGILCSFGGNHGKLEKIREKRRKGYLRADGAMKDIIVE